MPQATKIVIHFDDGTTHEVDPSKYGSIFSSEPRAKKCNHNPPYGKPPQNSGSTATLMSMTTTATAAAADADTEAAGTCYYINGVVICP